MFYLVLFATFATSKSRVSTTLCHILHL